MVGKVFVSIVQMLDEKKCEKVYNIPIMFFVNIMIEVYEPDIILSFNFLIIFKYIRCGIYVFNFHYSHYSILNIIKGMKYDSII